VKPPTSDLELIQGLQRGSNEAFAKVYEQYAEGVYAYCAKILADRQRAKDVVQETFLKIRQSTGQIQQGESFKSWIFRIARNECLMEIRKHRRNGQLDVNSVWQEETPHDRYVDLERAEIVDGLLESLKHEYREVLVLRAYEDLSYAEIAAVTGDTESSVKSRIFKARKAMSEKLKEYYE
jgi:RNA polymerase sigma-70 factor, ECF subfamily